MNDLLVSRCAEVAEAVFPHNNWRNERTRLAETLVALAEAISIPVIASGGLASIDDIKALLEPRARKLQGAIAGRALYDGRLDAAEALKLIRDARAAA